MIPFAGCTVRAGSQIKLVWWGRESIAGVQDLLLCSTTKLGKKKKSCFSSPPPLASAESGVVGETHHKKWRSASGKRI